MYCIELHLPDLKIELISIEQVRRRRLSQTSIHLTNSMFIERTGLSFMLFILQINCLFSQTFMIVCYMV